MSWLPVALLAVPLAGAALLAVPVGSTARGSTAQGPTARERWFPRYGLVVSGITLALSAALAVAFDHDDPARMQFVTDLPWIPGLGLRFHLGVDGVSLPLVLLTTLLTCLCFAYLCRGRSDRSGLSDHSGRPRALVFTLLVLEVGMIGAFLALDLLLFFVFFEVVLIPMYFVIAVWGGRRRRVAATKFILYTLLGSVVLLLGLLLIWAQTGTLDMTALARAHGTGMSRTAQILAFLAVGAGLAVKTPMWPLHTWLPDAHTEAPTVGSVLLAGVLLKMGTYGFARIAIPVLPGGAAVLAPWLGAFAVIGIIYGSLACLAQRDLKRMIAYSSIGHMGFVLLGFAALTPAGLNGALFGNVAHGLITALLFFVVGSIKERYGTAEIPSLGGGMLARLPRLGSVLTFAAVASLGLPGLAGFWGEMLSLLGAFRPAAGLPRSLYLVFMALGGLGTVLTAAYFLSMLSRVTHGRPVETVHAPVLAAVGPADAGGAGDAGRAGTEDAGREVSAADEGAAGASRAAGTPGSGESTTDVGTAGATADAENGEDSAAVDNAGRGGGRGRRGMRGIRDIEPHELVAWVPLMALILLLGLWPKALLDVIGPVARSLLGAP
ncbi:NADH-quinone oxidoreductase subunit M [Streptosporangium sp. NPDC048047]|uniref:complex I subunit 4 family protein n=1 Tax=Streptosporangium sp. NPDC048047 TaxID=3155748 RepID=UPI003441C4DC